MSVFHDNALVGASGQAGYQIERSLRFNSPDSAYLNRTPASTTETTAWTWSGWVKRSASGNKNFLGAFYGFNGRYFLLGFDSSDRLQAYGGNYSVNINPGVNVELYTTAVFRDFSAWMHVVFTYDSANATASDRARFYVNGSRITAFDVATYPGLSSSTYVNYSTTPHYIGTWGGGTAYLDGYLTEIHFVSGQALTPSNFGETNPVTGVWQPKKYAGTYGTNGFYLKFADNSGTTSTTLGKDSSGNGNNWTPNNFSVTAGAGNDSLIDVPTSYIDGGNGRGNYCTLNPLDKNSSVTLSNGNLDYSCSSGSNAKGTIGTGESGKWYFEHTITSSIGLSTPIVVGARSVNANVYASNPPPDSLAFWFYTDSSAWQVARVVNGTQTAVNVSGTSYPNTNDVLQIAYDASTGKCWLGKNNNWIDSSGGITGNPGAGTNPTHTVTAGQSITPALFNVGASYSGVLNCGQRSFSYTPPAGFLALNTQNLPEPSIKKPSSYMDVVTYTGNGTSQTISSLNFSPDLVWLKCRTIAYNHRLVDSVQGVTSTLSSNLTNAAVNTSSEFTSLNTNGFSVTQGSGYEFNNNAVPYVAWCWDKSATPGFDIVTYTGNGTARTIAHSLGVAPSMMIIKRRDAIDDWGVYHTSLGNTQYLYLDSTQAANTASAVWNNTSPTSSVFSVGTSAVVNANIGTYVSYLFSEVAGFSKFGSYTGNGSSDGPFVFCGFRPRWIMIKRTDSAVSWDLFDTARDTYNTSGLYLYPNLSNAESDGRSANGIDILSNGFKWRSSGSGENASGGTFIFAAFAESPQKYSLAR